MGWLSGLVSWSTFIPFAPSATYANSEALESVFEDLESCFPLERKRRPSKTPSNGTVAHASGYVLEKTDSFGQKSY